MNNNLPELRDIHIPDGVSVFPLAYGWYVIMAVIVLIFVAYRVYHIWRRRSRKIYALKLLSELNDNDVILSAVKVSELLRRICLYRYPDAVVLHGKPWLSFLSSHTKSKLSIRAGELLLNAPYIKISDNNFSVDDFVNLKVFARSWIGENL